MKKFTDTDIFEKSVYDKDSILKSLLEDLSIEIDLKDKRTDYSNNYDIVVEKSDIEKINKIYEKEHIEDKLKLLEKVKYAFYRQDIKTIDDEIEKLKNMYNEK